MLQRVLLLALMCGVGQAAPLCVPGTLTSYIALNPAGGCNVFNLRYFNFSFSVAENTDLIQVTPNNIPTSPGLGFSPPGVGPGVNATFSINYTVDPPPIMAGQRDSLDPTGNDSATQLICLNQFFGAGPLCADNITPPVQLTVTFPASPNGFLPFATFESMIDVRTTITLTGGATGASIKDLLTQTDVVPEPATVGLVAVALLAMVQCRRRAAGGRP